MNNHKKALPLLQEIIRNELFDFRQDAILIARLVFMMIHYNLKNYDLVLKSMIETAKYCQQNELIFKTSDNLLDLLKLLIRNDGKRSKLNELLKKFKNELLPLEKNHDERKIIELTGVMT